MYERDLQIPGLTEDMLAIESLVGRSVMEDAAAIVIGARPNNPALKDFEMYCMAQLRVKYMEI